MGLNGTQHLLKALGIDPAEITQGIEAFKKSVLEVKAAQERIESKLDRILTAVERDAEAPSKDVDEMLDHLSLNSGIDPHTAGFFVLPRGKSTMVKEGQFFRDSGGLTEEWGKAWVPVNDTSLEDARHQGSKMLVKN
jgi:hypothetical protein